MIVFPCVTSLNAILLWLFRIILLLLHYNDMRFIADGGGMQVLGQLHFDRPTTDQFSFIWFFLEYNFFLVPTKLWQLLQIIVTPFNSSKLYWFMQNNFVPRFDLNTLKCTNYFTSSVRLLLACWSQRVQLNEIDRQTAQITTQLTILF